MRFQTGINIVVVMMVLLILTACGGTQNYGKYSEGMGKTNQSNALLGNSYFEKKGATDALIIAHLSEKGNETAIVLYGIITNQTDLKVLDNLKAIPLAVPMTDNEVYATVAKETIPTVVKWGFGYLGVKELMDGFSAAGAVTMQGDNNRYVLQNPSGSASATMKLDSGDVTNPLPEAELEVVE